MKTHFLLFAMSLLLLQACNSHNDALFTSSTYSIYGDRVTQDSFEARAHSATHLTSNYQSPANAFQSASIAFKFSINGKDNEMLPGTNHQYTVKSAGGIATTPVIKFGEPLNQPAEEGLYLQPETSLTIRLDMRGVQKQFAEQGFFTTAKGEKIYREDFKAVYVAGEISPMTWDFDNLKNRAALELKDPDGDGIFETTLVLNSRADKKQLATEWKLSRDISAFPQYQSPHVLADALYNMALEEMENAVEKDSTLRTGKEWAGVWTRDVSYSIILSMAYLQPQVAKNSLLRKVNARKRIIQDTGTGGAWPASTDRMIWAVAAWEIYLVQGDKAWLEQAYDIILNSLEEDYVTAYDERTGLVMGESSFLDWREQTYPKWMQPADIFGSLNLGTNAVHYQANRVAQQMAKVLGKNEEAAYFGKMADGIKGAINQYLWQEDKGYYGQYLYGRNYRILSPRSEALGEALCVLFGIAEEERATKVVTNTPVVRYGIPCIYPQIPDIPPYHNNGVWPFVQAYWLLASAKAGNEASVMESIASIYRPAALFLTNKENFVAANGDFSGTVINSSNMLWSLSGNISLVHKVLFGIRFGEDGLSLNPFVPKAMQGKRRLANFRYRQAVIDFEMEGYGNEIASLEVDGRKQEKALLPAGLSGKHTVRIVLANRIKGESRVNKLANIFTPATPLATYRPSELVWNDCRGAVRYQVLRNGTLLTETTGKTLAITPEGYSEYQVIAIDAQGFASFASEPVVVAEASLYTQYEAESFAPRSSLPYKGYSGEGFVEISRSRNPTITMPITIAADGLYAVDFRYSNGNGPINTENKCAIRSLYLDSTYLGAVVMPQRGTGEWSAWGYSYPITVPLSKGQYFLVLKFEDWNENMHGEINHAMLDAVRIIRVSDRKL